MIKKKIEVYFVTCSNDRKFTCWCPQIKFYWHIVTCIHLRAVWGCICAERDRVEEWWQRRMAHPAWNVDRLALYRKCLLTSGPEAPAESGSHSDHPSSRLIFLLQAAGFPVKLSPCCSTLLLWTHFPYISQRDLVLNNFAEVQFAYY